MKIEKLLKKPNWYRRTADYRNIPPAPMTAMYPTFAPLTFDTSPKVVVTQAQMLDELDPNSHIIYNVFHRSNRPKYKYDDMKKKNIPDGYEPVERVSIAFQAAIRRHKVTHAFGNPVWFGNESGDGSADEMVQYKAHWNVSGMNNALIEFGNAAFGVAEGAIYCYRDNNEIKYRVFSFEKGDLFAPCKDPKTGKDAVVRTFLIEDVQCVEIYGSEDIELWAKVGSTAETSDMDRLRAIWDDVLGEKSEDGYVLISRTIHGLDECPVAYHREPAPCWGDAQSNIDAIEKLLSDLLENGKYYNFQIMFLSGKAISLPNMNFQGKVMGSETEGGDAKILAPADASNTFSISLEQEFKAMCNAVNAVFIDYKELKGQNDSGAYLRNLYFPETQWCMDAYARMHPFFKKLFSIFKKYVGIIEGRSAEFDKLKFSYLFTPFVPQNETEEIQNINSSVASGTMSIETACEEHPQANPQEFQRLQKQAEREQQEDVSTEQINVVEE